MCGAEVVKVHAIEDKEKDSIATPENTLARGSLATTPMMMI